MRSLLRRAEPHIIRAALTGLRKSVHELDKSKRDEATHYCTVAAGPASSIGENLAGQAVTGSAVPRTSPDMLRLALAWEIQARVHGGLPHRPVQLLHQFKRGKTRARETAPGMRLVREWNGRTHIVKVGEDKVIRWNKREWRSLSEVARAITGTRWSRNRTVS